MGFNENARVKSAKLKGETQLATFDYRRILEDSGG